MTLDEATFAIQRPRYLVEEYTWVIQEFGLDGQKVYYRAGVGKAVRDDKIESSLGRWVTYSRLLFGVKSFYTKGRL